VGDGATIAVHFGDFAPEMAKVAAALLAARNDAANDTQREMLTHYVAHFEEGPIAHHKASQRAWVRDKGCAVESNIGFIESYRDPSGVRAEWEGFVAVVDKDESEKYGRMVDAAPTFIARLPWGKAFENDKFTQPDFTSLQVLGFASSGIPIGICIPNYDDVRKDYGFKNVYLANVVSAFNPNDKMNHVTDADWEKYRAKLVTVFSVGVGIHELLGHGTGKLLTEDDKGTKNFDPAATVSPLTGQPVTSWYKPGETWGSVFGFLASAYEECRAEAVALYLGTEPDMLSLFGEATDAGRFDVIHVLWLNMCRAGLVGLEFYSPEQKKWRQAHMHARFCILQTLRRQANSIVTITHDPATGKLQIELDAARIATDGKKAIGDLLTHLNVYKATADAAAGHKYFNDLTAVDDECLALRETVMKCRKPRRQCVQPHTRLTADGKDAEVVEFESSVDGAIRAMVTRHREIPL